MKNDMVEKLASSEIAQSREPYPWTIETMRLINSLTPDIKEKAFDPDWFLLRQRFEQMEELSIMAERDTRERCAQLVMDHLCSSTPERLELAERIRGKESA